MAGRDKIQTDLIKLTSGEWLLRLTDLQSGLSLEKKLDEKQPVVREKGRLLGVFEAVLVQVELSAA